MTALKIDRMTADEFLAWATTQEGKYELVDGIPRMMVGARKAHDRVVRRALAGLASKLAGSPCEPFSDDLAVHISSIIVRRPDVMVDCGDPSDDLLKADKPVLVIQALSPLTRLIDLLVKTIEYKTVPSLRHILIIDPDEVIAIHHYRHDAGPWQDATLIGRETVIPLTGLGIELTLGEFYEAES
jgi:Uma2 family endonuclease